MVGKMNKDDVSPLRDQVAGIGRADYPPTQAQIDAADRLAVKIVTLVSKRISKDGKLYAYDGVEAAREIRQLILNKNAMTGPTQAQIEAEEMRAFGASEFACSKWPEDTLEHKALRAAFIEGAALTAAAEAGPKYEIQLDAWMYRKLQEHEAATIERCAQAAEGFGVSSWHRGPEIAAAIRVMKDQLWEQYPNEATRRAVGWSESQLETVGRIHNTTIERCAQVADNEPEAPGDMPPELHLIPIEDAIRAAIRATKKSISRRIRAMKDKP